MGFIILYTSQILVLDLLSRNVTDAAYSTSNLLRRITGGDSRKFFYPFMVILLAGIAAVLHLGEQKFLADISANIANFAALIFPLGLIYLNRKLPKPAKSRWWSTLALLLNTLFFGFFFVNFLAVQITGSPLVSF
jgi:hypothetical protein